MGGGGGGACQCFCVHGICKLHFGTYHTQHKVMHTCMCIQVHVCTWVPTCRHTHGGRNSSVGSAWARCPQRRGFDPPLGTFSVEGIFPLELTWVQTPFSPKTPSDESINRGLVCAYMHFIARTQKILTFMS